MLIYFDSNIVIYAVEVPNVFGAKALTRLQAISRSDRIAVSELTRTECCYYPLRQTNFRLLRLYDGFFLRRDVTILPVSSNVFRRATVIQAVYDFTTVDAIHLLATATESGCHRFLTNDKRLSRFAEVAVEVLA